jgi:hypothetical protein
MAEIREKTKISQEVLLRQLRWLQAQVLIALIMRCSPRCVNRQFIIFEARNLERLKRITVLQQKSSTVVV